MIKPGETSDPILYTALVGAPSWEAVKHDPDISARDVPNPPRFIAVKNRSNKRLSLLLKVKSEEKAKRKPSTIVLKPQSSKAFRLDSLGTKQVRDLTQNRSISVSPISLVRLPSKSSYGYDSGVHICDKCGGPIIFRGSPPRPVHV